MSLSAVLQFQTQIMSFQNSITDPTPSVTADLRLHRYCQPKKGGVLKCSKATMDMWKTTEGSHLVARIQCAYTYIDS